MATERQALANRNNAQRSTGPKTGSGKAIVAKNAAKHGLLSKEVLLDTEDRKALEAFKMQMVTALNPVGPLEELLVDRIVASAWRLRRLVAVEAGVFHQEMNNMFGPKEDVGLAFIRDGNGADAFSKLSRYESAIERSLYRAMHELERAQANRMGQNVPMPVIVEIVGETDVSKA